MRGNSFEQILISFTQGCIVQGLVEISPWLLEKIFEFRQYILAISELSPLGKWCGPLFRQTWIPYTQGCYVSSSVEFAKWFWKIRFLKFRQYIFAISPISPLRKESGPSFEQTWISFNRGYFVQSLVEIDPVVLGDDNVKSLQTDKRLACRRTTDNRWSLFTLALSSGELKTCTW